MRETMSTTTDLPYIASALRPLAVPIEDLVPDPANARTHPAENLGAIRASLRVYGQRKPVVVNRRTGVVEAGNGTLAAARELGWTHLAAVYVDDEPVTAAGFAVADNRSSELAEWDDDALAKLLPTIETDDAELRAMFDKLTEDAGLNAAADEPEATPTIPEQFSVLVTCKTEAEQVKLLERLSAEGFQCRSLIS